MLNPAQSRTRQRRLLDALQGQPFDALVVGLPHHAYYFSAMLPRWFDQAALVILSDGYSVLACPGRADGNAAIDEVRPAKAIHRQEQPILFAEAILDLFRSRGVKRIGIDASPTTAQVAARFDGAVRSIDSILWQQRRVKDADELELMQTAIRCTEAMHRRARQIIEPGITELRVYNELISAAVETAGEPLTSTFGNDFASGVPGGPARNRAIEAGELYILDLGPSYRGYFADNSRVIAVDRRPTDVQMRTWEALHDCFPIVEQLAKPGARTLDLVNAVSTHLQQRLGRPLPHHLGHGVGLLPQEFPHLKPDWDGVLLEGEVITAEPGLYGPDPTAPIRLENQYLITADGVKNLTPFPMELV